MRKAVNSAGIVPINRGPSEIDRQLPHSKDAEVSVLGAIILDNHLTDIAIEKLHPEDFYIDAHRIIFAQMCEMSRRGIPSDPVLLIEELTAAGKIEAVGGNGFISDLPKGLPRVSNIEHYIRIVKSKSQLRQCARLALALEQRALDPDAEPTDLVPYIQQLSTATEAQETRAETLRILDMSEDVLDGRLGDFCTTRMSGLPVAYSWPAIVTVAGTLVPPSDARTNVYGCLIGGIGTGKSQAIVRAIATLGLEKPLLENTLAGSFEGLSDRLAVDGEARLLSPDEIGHLLQKSKIDGASFPFVLNSAFYRSAFDVTAARGKQVHVNCRLGIVGGIVEEKFSSLFGAATTGGLFDRFVFGRCPSPFEYHYRPFQGGPEYTEPCPVTIAPDVWELIDTWLKAIHGLSTRTAELTIRVATVAAAFSGRSILYAKHIEKSGRAFAEYQTRIRAAFRPNPGENTDAQCAWDIRAWLSEHPGWNTKRNLYRGVSAYRYGPAAFERSITAMIAGGELNVDSGRPAKIRLVE